MAGLSLGLDGGGSATRWVVCDEAGTILGRGELPSISGHLFNEAERVRLGKMAAALGEAVAGFGITAAVAGITGLTTGSAEAGLVATAIREAVGVGADVHDDLWIAFHAAFRPGEGHVVYAGTGSIGLHVRADGGVLRVGGRGMLIDDGGSAFWIGREALRLIWRRIDTSGAAGGTALPRALFAALGTSEWDGVREAVYGGGRDAVAQLARAVADAAVQGDDDALGLLRAAGAELALLARAMIGRAGLLPVVLMGRAAKLHPAILESMRNEVPGIRLVSVDAAGTAARMAAGKL